MKNFVFCILSQIGIVNQLFKRVIFPLYEHKTDMIRSHFPSFGLKPLVCFRAAIFAKEIIAHDPASVIIADAHCPKLRCRYDVIFRCNDTPPFIYKELFLPEYRLGYGGLITVILGKAQPPALIKINYRLRFAELFAVVLGNEELTIRIK